MPAQEKVEKATGEIQKQINNQNFIAYTQIPPNLEQPTPSFNEAVQKSRCYPTRKIHCGWLLIAFKTLTVPPQLEMPSLVWTMSFPSK